MPSRAKIRSTIETALRVLSIVILAWMFWLSLDRGRPERAVVGKSATLASSLREWSRAGIPPDRISIGLEENPTPAHRDWIRALSHSGSSVAWHGDLAAAAVSAQPIASPRGGFSVVTAAAKGNRVTIEDDLGTLEGEDASSGGARFLVPSATGKIRAKVGRTTAYAAAPDSIRLGRVLVIGTAGWETKFVTAALEEEGWKVDADIHVAPTVDVTQGSISLDTARYSAVIALDGSAALRASDIVRFATMGGGVILAGSSGAIEAFSAIRPGTTGRVQNGSILEAEPGTVTQASLASAPINGLRGDAVSVESRGSEVVTAARRHVAGRVLQTGYLETWRWRMSGGDDAPAQHREWWSRAVASVAYAPAIRSSATGADDSPVASLVEAIGHPSQQSQSALASAAGSISLWLLFAILSLSLLGEWASRRLRSER